MSDTTTGRYLRYEGFPLESVLARVSQDHGAAATITSAERVRRGGVKGFFAREVFQVIVDVSGASEPFDPAGIDPEDVDGALALDDITRPTRVFNSVEATDAREEPDMSFGQSFGEDADLWALLASAATSQAPPIEPPVFQGAQSATATSTTAVAPDVVDQPVAHQPVAHQPAVPHALSAGVVDDEPPYFPTAADLLASAPPIPSWTSPVRSDLPFVTETVAKEAIEAELVQPLRALGPIATTTVIPAAPASPGSVFGTPFDPFRRPAQSVEEARVADAQASAAPAAVARSAAPLALRGGLHDLLASLDESLPPAPAVPQSGVIVMVGERGEAIAAAHRLAASCSMSSDAVLVASPAPGAPIPSTTELAALAQAAAAKASPRCIVVVELLAGRTGHEWTRAVSAGVAPTQVRFVGDAERFAAHQHLSIAAIGGVDVVDLLHIEAVSEPTAALAVGIPIGSLDGRPATSELWAAVMLAARTCSDESISQSSAAWFGAEGE